MKFYAAKKNNDEIMKAYIGNSKVSVCPWRSFLSSQRQTPSRLVAHVRPLACGLEIARQQHIQAAHAETRPCRSPTLLVHQRLETQSDGSDVGGYSLVFEGIPQRRAIKELAVIAGAWEALPPNRQFPDIREGVEKHTSAGTLCGC